MPRRIQNPRKYDPPGRVNHVPPPLTPAERRFLDELLVDMDEGRAAIDAGFPTRAYGRKLLAIPRVNMALLARLRRRAERVHVEADYILRRWFLLESADPREISEHWMVPCRYCWGDEHQFQFNDVELRDATQAHKFAQLKIEDETKRTPFDEQGGGGYTILKPPCRGPDWAAFEAERGHSGAVATADHTCPACYGEGVHHVIFHDTRTLSPGAALLYKGVKQTGKTYEILTRDQDAAREQMAKHLGMFVERKLILVADARQMTDLELNNAITIELESLRDASVTTGGDPLELEAPAGETSSRDSD